MESSIKRRSKFHAGEATRSAPSRREYDDRKKVQKTRHGLASSSRGPSFSFSGEHQWKKDSCVTYKRRGKECLIASKDRAGQGRWISMSQRINAEWEGDDFCIGRKIMPISDPIGPGTVSPRV